MKGVISIKINVNLILELINKEFQGNYKSFAREINVNSVTVYRILTERSNAGVKFISNFMKFCRKRGEKIDKFFFE